MAASDSALTTRRLFVTCQRSKKQFLVDTGSDISVYPRTATKGCLQPTAYTLYAANGTVIPTYGNITLEPNLGLRRTFPWRFVIADVSHPIIGADFLSYYHILPDLRKQKLLDGTTGIEAAGTIHTNKTPSVKALSIKKSSSTSRRVSWNYTA